MSMMRNFDTELDRLGVARMTLGSDHPAIHQPVVRAASTEVVIEEQMRVTPRPSMVSKAYLGKDVWGWDDLRDYVVGEIEARFGPFPRDSRKESGIFKAFLDRHGDHAQAIARFAFEVCGGRWKGSPISVNRFCKGSDPYFSEVIKARLAEGTIEGW